MIIIKVIARKRKSKDYQKMRFKNKTTIKTLESNYKVLPFPDYLNISVYILTPSETVLGIKNKYNCEIKNETFTSKRDGRSSNLLYKWGYWVQTN